MMDSTKTSFIEMNGVSKDAYSTARLNGNSIEETVGREENDEIDIVSDRLHEAPLERSRYGLKPLFQAIKRYMLAPGTDVDPPPDGGFSAWCMCVMTWFALFNTWGFVQSFGVFQTYFVTVLQETPSAISSIGSVQVFLLFIIGPLSGRAVDAGFFRPVFWAGLILQLLGVFMTSVATRYWHVFLAQGVCQGIGGGLQFVPTMSLLSTYFQKKRSMVIGMATTGTTIGGMIMPVMVQQLLPKVGFAWTVRALGLVIAVLGTTAGLVLKPRVPPRKSGPLVEWRAFTETPFILFSLGMFMNFWGLYFPFYYVGSYARDVLHQDYSATISYLFLMNGVGVPGRVLPNIIADRYLGPTNSIVISCVIGGVIAFSWAAVHETTGLWIFTALFGFFSGGMASLYPACLAALTPDLQKRGVRMGMSFGVVGIACLTGLPLAGALVEAGHGRYLIAQLWAGACIILGTMFLVASRIATVGTSLRVKC